MLVDQVRKLNDLLGIEFCPARLYRSADEKVLRTHRLGVSCSLSRGFLHVVPDGRPLNSLEPVAQYGQLLQRLSHIDSHVCGALRSMLFKITKILDKFLSY